MRLAQARRLALALPEAREAPHFDKTSFRVNGKIFATATSDGAYLHVFVNGQERDAALATEPSCTEKLWWGQRVWGVRVKLAAADARFVKTLLAQAWRAKAPKKLVASLPASKRTSRK